MKKIQKILITGGSGFIGSYLVQELLDKDNEVIVFDNGSRLGFESSKHPKNFTLVKGDITKTDTWKKLPTDIDFVYHLAAINGTKFFYEIPDKVLKVNVQGTLNLVNWLENTSAFRVFFASSSEVYGFPNIFPTPETHLMAIPDPLNPRYSYSSSKIIGETIMINCLKKLGIDFTIGRFHNVYGPRMGFEHVIPEFIRKCVKEKKFIIQGTGEETRSFCYISDAINAMTLASGHQLGKNEIFNIGTCDEVSISTLINLLSKIHGKKITPIKSKFEKHGTNRRVPDISKIQKLGYNPKVILEDGLRKCYEWYANYYQNH